MTAAQENLELLRSDLSQAYPVRAITPFDDLLTRIDVADAKREGSDAALTAELHGRSSPGGQTYV